MRHVRLAALAIAVMLALSACGSSAASAPAAPSGAPSAAPPAATSATAPSGAGSAVSIVNFSFQPATITVPVGSTVTWTNNDSAGHTVTADDGSFNSNKLASGTTFSQTFATAGTFAYHCTIHSSMKGTITVH